MNRTPCTIIENPDAILKTKSKEVRKVTNKTRYHVERMFDTLHENKIQGLSAIQIGLKQRIVVTDMSRGEDGYKDCIVLINPVIVEKSMEQTIAEEECISYPNVTADVIRPCRIDVQFLDFMGIPRELTATGKHARILQANIEHLDGTWFADYSVVLKEKENKSNFRETFDGTGLTKEKLRSVYNKLKRAFEIK